MNYYEARQLKEGGWHFTRYNKRLGTFPVGYCKDCKPHATKEEAEACYKKYLLEKELFWHEMHDRQEKCAECGKFTVHYCEVGRPMGQRIVLCTEHTDCVEKHFEAPTQVWSS